MSEPQLRQKVSLQVHSVLHSSHLQSRASRGAGLSMSKPRFCAACGRQFSGDVNADKKRQRRNGGAEGKNPSRDYQQYIPPTNMPAQRHVRTSIAKVCITPGPLRLRFSPFPIPRQFCRGLTHIQAATFPDVRAAISE
jgi:hypothetical protein